jgi:hypothetical protein
MDLAETRQLDKYKRHTIEVMVDDSSSTTAMCLRTPAATPRAGPWTPRPAS